MITLNNIKQETLITIGHSFNTFQCDHIAYLNTVSLYTTVDQKTFFIRVYVILAATDSK